MYVVCIHCILQLYIDPVIVTNECKTQINVLAGITRFITVAEMLLLGLFPRPRLVADVPNPNAYGHLRLSGLTVLSTSSATAIYRRALLKQVSFECAWENLP